VIGQGLCVYKLIKKAKVTVKKHNQTRIFMLRKVIKNMHLLAHKFINQLHKIMRFNIKQNLKKNVCQKLLLKEMNEFAINQTKNYDILH
jgi:hypothetical protein